EMKEVQMKDLFQRDPERFTNLSIRFGDLLFDYSKNIVTQETLEHFLQLADDCQLKTAINAMFNGERINETENRAVMHTALRNFSGKGIEIDGTDIMPDV